MDGHGLLLAFDTNDPCFTRGFEMGRIWALLRAFPDEAVSEYAHAANGEMLLRMAEATGREIRSEELGGEWMVAFFTPSH